LENFQPKNVLAAIIGGYRLPQATEKRQQLAQPPKKNADTTKNLTATNQCVISVNYTSFEAT
jgi:hypothetical protein